MVGTWRGTEPRSWSNPGEWLKALGSQSLWSASSKCHGVCTRNNTYPEEISTLQKIHMCQGYKRLPHKQTFALDVENLLWEEWQGGRKTFFPLFCFFFKFQQIFPKALKVTAQTAWFPSCPKGSRLWNAKSSVRKDVLLLLSSFSKLHHWHCCANWIYYRLFY